MADTTPTVRAESNPVPDDEAERAEQKRLGAIGYYERALEVAEHALERAKANDDPRKDSVETAQAELDDAKTKRAAVKEEA